MWPYAALRALAPRFARRNPRPAASSMHIFSRGWIPKRNGRRGEKYIPFWDYTIMGCIVKRMSRSVHSDDYKGIIKRLKGARVEAGLSQQDVADKLGKPQSYVSKIESGERRLDVAEIKKFASVYKKNVSFFIK
jgi:DNA-binding XRE family transcriptional regulator